MFTKRMALHEGGHGHAGCCGEHAHEHAHEHVCGHHHEHGAEVPELSPELPKTMDWTLTAVPQE